MGSIDHPGEYLRLTEHYRQMTDEELVELARQNTAFTEIAQQTLAQEVSARRLKIPPEERLSRPEPPPDVPDPEDPYSEQRRLVQIETVWSLRDAMKLQYLLDAAGIPFYMGLEKATSVDAVTSNFAKGVPVGVMNVGWPWAARALRNYTPEDEPPEEKVEPEEWLKLEVRCPKCRSNDVIFERLVKEAGDPVEERSEKWEWTCAACGHEWQDDGVVKR